MTNKFCQMLSNGLFLTDKSLNTRDMVFKPCCYYKTESTILEREKWNNIQDWIDQCNICQAKESDGKNKSLRIFSNHLVPAKDNAITHLEIDYSNACNAACGICIPQASSKIAKIMREERINYVPTPTVKKQKFIDQIKSLDLSNLQYLKFKGGEPLYLDFHKEVISLIDNKENIKIFYQTNGSIYPDKEWWEMSKNFKSIHFSFSVDAVGDRFNFIRAGLNWEDVNANIKKIISGSEKITASIQCTYNPLNLFYHSELFRYTLELKKINKSMEFNWHHAWGEWGIENCTISLRNIINEKYKNIFSEILDIKPFNEEKHQKFIRSLALHEKRFGFNGENTFPEIWDLAIKF